jgi:hypothetical protein
LLGSNGKNISNKLFSLILTEKRPMAFDRPIAEMAAFRAAYICSNPECNCLTAGPALSESELKTKLGEAAHIVGEGAISARHRAGVELTALDNAIWLCASCHTTIDKNNGDGYPETLLHEWKKGHEQMVGMLVRSHKTPFPVLIQKTLHASIAQRVADLIAFRGAFTAGEFFEFDQHVFASVDSFKVDLLAELKKIAGDLRLRKVTTDLANGAKKFLNATSTGDVGPWAHLQVLRDVVAHGVRELDEHYDVEWRSDVSELQNRFRAGGQRRN